MRAINHALAGAAIGFIVPNPVVAIVVALFSHIVLDTVPHFGMRGDDDMVRPWFKILLVVDASACIALVGVLAYAHPLHWLLAAVCAFLATAYDLIWIRRFVLSLRKGKAVPVSGWLERFHGDSGIQWFQRPPGLIVEVVFFAAMIVVLIPFLR